MMRIILQIISWIALGLTILPSMLFCAGMMELPTVKWLMLVATIVWLGVTPFWMGREGVSSPQE
ncbi:MAG: hypothetical protein RBU29_05520 [bacterium]|jgi:hypothetical protein|nr:hypothetical protein [bacterium]